MKKLYSLLLFLAVNVMVTAQVVNDDCANAVQLQVNPNLTQTFKTAGTIAGATASPEANTCGGFDDDDVWYKFVATNTSHQINITDIEGSTLDLNHVVYEGINCGTLIQKYCSNPNNSIANGLTIGQTYRIRIYSAIQTPGQNTSFKVSITTLPQSPANDLCENATLLSINPTPDCVVTTQGTLYQATNSSSIYENQSEDVWYKFVATNPKHILKINNITGNISSLRFEVYKDDCSYVYPSFYIEGDYLTSLIVGNTYKIRVYAWQGASASPSSFSICLGTNAPQNDECENAIMLPVNPNLITELNNSQYVTVTGETIYTSSSSSEPYDYCGYKSKDIWYEFVATSNSHYISILDKSGTSVNYVVYSGTCNNLTHLLCADNYSLLNKHYDSFIPGQTYKIRLYGLDGGTVSSFRIVIGTIPPPPLNDECSNAITVPVNPDLNATQKVRGTLDSATTSSQNNTCATQFSQDVWFEFTATNTRHTINLTNAIPFTYADVSHSVYEGECNNLILTEGHCNGATQSFFQYEIGKKYKIRVYSNLAQTANTLYTFDISIGTPPAIPANDECTNAIAITPTASGAPLQLTHAVITSATASQPSMEQACYNTNSPIYDIWYEFTATNATHYVDILNKAGYLPLNSVIYTGECGSLTYKSCVIYPNIASNLTVGETYKLRIGTTYLSSELKDFDIAISTPGLPPANDECANAIALTVNPAMEPIATTTASLYLATPSNAPAPSCGGLTPFDTWFTFTATSTMHQIVKSNTYAQLTIYKANDCNNLTEIGCYYENNTTLKNLIPGQVYKIRAYTTYVLENDIADITLSILTLPPTPINDECANAVTLTVNNGTECTGITASLSSATNSNSTDYSPDNDIWFKFTATGIQHYINVSNYGTKKYFYELYTGVCDATQYKDGGTVIESPTLRELVPGQIYTLRIMSSNISANEIISFDICLTNPPVPANDNCGNPVTLSVNNDLNSTLYTEGSLFGATVSQEADCNMTSDDVWYKFTATSTVHEIKIFDVPQNTAIQYTLYSGSQCNSLVNLSCNNSNSIINNFAKNLVIGQTYMVKIRSKFSESILTKFKIAINTPHTPSNDDCSGAIAAVVNPGTECLASTTGTFLMSSSSVVNDSCTINQTSSKDLWFEFVATGTTHKIEITNGTIYNSAFYLYSGDDCNSLTPLICNPTEPYPEVNNLVVGQTYKIRVFGNSYETIDLMTINICITTPESCKDATAFVTGYNDYLFKNTPNQPELGSIACIENVISPAWFSIEITTSGDYVYEITQNTAFDVYGNPTGYPADVSYVVWGPFNNPFEACEGLTSSSIIDCAYYNRQQFTINNAEAGQSYIVLVSKSMVDEDDYTKFHQVSGPPASDVPTPTFENEEQIYTSDQTLADVILNENEIIWYDNPGTPNPDIDTEPFSFSTFTTYNVNDGVETPLPLTTQLVNGVTYYAAQKIYGIESTVRLPIILNVVNATPAPTGEATQTFTTGETLADLEVTGENIKWYTSSSSTEVLPATTPLVDGTTYYASQTINDVESTDRLAVTVSLITVAITPPPTGITEQWFNEGETLSDLEVTGENIKWYADATTTVALPETTSLVDGTTYYASQTIDDLESTNRLAVTTFLIVVTPAPTGATEQTYTEGETLANLEVTGQNIKWYADSSSTEDLLITTPLVDGSTYYASQTINNVESTQRLGVTVHLTLGSNDVVFEGLRYYPNPTTSILNIENKNSIDNITIANALGQSVIKTAVNNNNAQVDLSSLSRGVYFVTITSGNASATLKVIKE